MFPIKVILTLLLVGKVISNDDFGAKIFFFFGNTYDFHVSYDLDKAAEVMYHPSFNTTKKLVLYSHGFVEDVEFDTTRTVVDAYIQNGNYNILVIDWRNLAFNLIYPLVASSMEQLGSATAVLLLQLVAQQYPIEQIHVVGHSLGAQLAGYIGRSVMSQSNGTMKLKRLSGLDPAGPDYYFIKIDTEHITKNDAEFVDIIHTNPGIFGAPVSTGKADFWPNPGRIIQPGCIIPIENVVCSHQRSVYYWAESVRNGPRISFTSTNTKTGDHVQMGNNCPSSASGNYFLETNSWSPYSKG